MKRLLPILFAACVPLASLAVDTNRSLTYNAQTFVIVAPTNSVTFWQTNSVSTLANLLAASNALNTKISSATNSAGVSLIALTNSVVVLQGQTNTYTKTNELTTLSNRVVTLEAQTNSYAQASTSGVNRIVVDTTNCTGNVTLIGRGIFVYPDSTHSTITFRAYGYITKNLVLTNEIYEAMVDMPMDESIILDKIWAQSDNATFTIDVLSGPASALWRNAPTTNYSGMVGTTTGSYGSAWTSSNVLGGYKIMYRVSAVGSGNTNGTLGLRYYYTP